MGITGTHAAASTESHLLQLLTLQLALLRLQGHTFHLLPATGLRLLGTPTRKQAEAVARASFHVGDLISILDAMDNPEHRGGGGDGCYVADDSRSSCSIPRTGSTNQGKHDLLYCSTARLTFLLLHPILQLGASVRSMNEHLVLPPRTTISRRESFPLERFL